MKISIIVPTFNSEKTLKYCLKSIQQQSLTDFECLVIDASETKETKKSFDAIAKEDKRFHFYKSPYKGAMSQRSYGILMAKGDYVGFVDSDDLIPANYYDSLYYAINKLNVDFVCASSSRTVFNDKNIQLAIKKRNNAFHIKTIKRNDNYRNKIISLALYNKLFKRDMLIGACKYYNHNNQLQLWEDSILTYYVYIHSLRYAINKELFYYYIKNQDSVTNNYKYDLGYLMNCIKVTKILFDILAEGNWKKKQASIYALFGSINYLIYTNGHLKTEFKKTRKMLLTELNTHSIITIHKEFSNSENILSFCIKYNFFYIAKVVIKRIRAIKAINVSV